MLMEHVSRTGGVTATGATSVLPCILYINEFVFERVISGTVGVQSPRNVHGNWNYTQGHERSNQAHKAFSCVYKCEKVKRRAFLMIVVSRQIDDVALRVVIDNKNTRVERSDANRKT